MKNNRITIRIEPEEREQLDRLINEGKVKNLTEPIYKAFKKVLTELKEATPKREPQSLESVPGCFGFFESPLAPNKCEDCEARGLCRQSSRQKPERKGEEPNEQHPI